jgi:hypothetical protein
MPGFFSGRPILPSRDREYSAMYVLKWIFRLGFIRVLADAKMTDTEQDKVSDPALLLLLVMIAYSSWALITRAPAPQPATDEPNGLTR